MQAANEITGPYSARINGKATGLAGCSVSDCPRAARCLRQNALLQMRHQHQCGSERQFFIPISAV